MARSALREILATYLCKSPEHLQFTHGPNGKPAVEDLEFNLSHARNWAAIAVSHDVPVGIDIEAIRDNVEIDKLLHRIGEMDIHGSRAQLFHLWTRREARIKCMGGALMDIPPAHIIAIDIDAPEHFAASVALGNHLPVVRDRGGAA